MKRLYNLDSASYEHPWDREALDKVRGFNALNQVANWLLKWTDIKWRLIDLQGSGFHITPASCPELYGQVSEVIRTLDIPRIPDIYTQWGYFINAYTTGFQENTVMVLYSGAVDLLTPEERCFVVGHEAGHIKSGHVLYHTIVMHMQDILRYMPVAAKLSQAFWAAMFWWFRMSEFTADRAGLLACQNPDVALSALTKMSGVPQKYYRSFDKDTILRQAEEFKKENQDFINKAMTTFSVLDNTHPWTVLRAAELIKWIDSGEYERILSGAARECPVCHSQIPADAAECPVCGARVVY